jgi:hypothetical protein
MGIEVDSRNGSLVVARGKVQDLEDMLLQLEKI